MNNIFDEKETKYPWLKEKRAWIFYLEEIKKNPNMISGEIQGNRYLLDCETAKLLVWMNEYNIFTAVGISSLIEQIEYAGSRKVQNFSRGTRILYKGIQLQNAYLEHDTELLEYIDIKKELSREFININRYGFTEKGERFFKEVLYPKLLEVIRKILSEIERQAEYQLRVGEDNFVKRICKIVDMLCEDVEITEKDKNIEVFQKKQGKLISLVITSAVLAYYAMRDEWDIMEGFDEESIRDSIWQTLIRELDETLEKHKKALEILAKNSILFNIKVISEKFSEHLIRGERERGIHFLSIFLPNRHWAILQKRKNQFDIWTSYLVLLENNESKKKEMKSEILEKVISFPHTKEDDKILEKWGEYMCSSIEKIEISNSYGIQILLEWMQKTIPTVGIFSNSDGNIRINVLCNRILPSVYMNQNFKTLIFQRIIEYATEDNIQRFSTITWQRRERIGMKDLPFSIFFVKRGYMSAYSYYKSIVPIDGNLLKKWGEILRKQMNSEVFQNFQRLCDYMDVIKCLNDIQRRDAGSIKEYWQSDRGSVALNISQEILDTVYNKIVEKNFEPDFSIKDLLSDKDNQFSKWQDIYTIIAEMQAREVLEMPLENEKEKEYLSKLTENKAWDSLCSAWIYLCFRSDEFLKEVKEINQIYEEYMQDIYIEKKKKKC